MRYSPLAFGMAAIEIVNREAGKIQPPPPHLAFHHTDFAGACGIIKSRSLRATCLEDLGDFGELLTAIKLIEEVFKETAASSSAVPAFRELSSCLQQKLHEERRWTFISCFCKEPQSGYHAKEFGPYQLCVPIHDQRGLIIKPNVLSDTWLRSCIYDRQVFRNSIETVAEDLAILLSRLFPDEPIHRWDKERSAREIAQALLTLAVSLIESCYEKEAEWRIVCAPRLLPGFTAPKQQLIDFASGIKSDAGYRYISLADWRGRASVHDNVPIVSITAPKSEAGGEECETLGELLAVNASHVPLLYDHTR